MLRVLLAALSLLAAPSSAEPVKTLKVGMAIPSYAHGVLWIAKDAGFFKAEGLEVEIFVLKGSADAARLLLAGNLDVALAGGDAVVKADLAGGDLAAAAVLVGTFYHRIVGGESLREPAQLKGRSIGLPFLGGPQDMTVRAALKRSGLKPGDDVKLVNMGAEYARLAAVSQGRVDAVTSDAPPSVLDGLKLRVVADVPAWKIPFPYIAVVARRPFLEKDEDAALRFLKALCRAMDYYRGHEKESLAILARATAGEAGSKVDAAENYRLNGPSRFTFPPTADAAGFKTVLELLDPAPAKPPKPEDFVDGRLLARLRREGFFH
jgi:NitT/TauT family transport system substrate-binding protein